jgi:hypothetical protein
VTHTDIVSLSVLFPSSHSLPSHQGDVFVSGHLAAEGKQRPASIEQSSCHINQGILPLNRSMFLPVFPLPNHSSSFTCYFGIVLLQECTSGSMKSCYPVTVMFPAWQLKCFENVAYLNSILGEGNNVRSFFFTIYTIPFWYWSNSTLFSLMSVFIKLNLEIRESLEYTLWLIAISKWNSLYFILNFVVTQFHLVPLCSYVSSLLSCPVSFNF